MPKEELIGGLRNALERGQDLDSAIKSMVAAGYNSKEVDEAARMMSQKGATAMIAGEKPKPATEAPAPTEEGKIPAQQKEHLQKTIKDTTTKRKNTKKWIIIIILAFILSIVLGIGAFFLFT